jgi:hypothetical protein
MKTLEALKVARAKIEQGWCPNTRAMDKQGWCVDGLDPRAVRWCALGALDAALGYSVDDPHEPVRELDKDVPAKYRDYASPAARVAQYSNRCGQKATLSLYDATIQRLISRSYANCLQGLRR